MTAWRRDIDRLTQRIDAKLTEVAADVAELKTEAHGWQQSHERQHEAETAERTTGRRWLVSTLIAALALLVTAVGLLVSINAHVH